MRRSGPAYALVIIRTVHVSFPAFANISTEHARCKKMSTLWGTESEFETGKEYGVEILRRTSGSLLLFQREHTGVQ